MMEHSKYFKIRKERQDWLGVRYFKFRWDEEKVVQVCLFTGEVKKGKSNTFGVYLINRLTMLSNYYSPNYIEPCSKKEYEKMFNQVVKCLK